MIGSLARIPKAALHAAVDGFLHLLVGKSDPDQDVASFADLRQQASDDVGSPTETTSANEALAEVVPATR